MSKLNLNDLLQKKMAIIVAKLVGNGNLINIIPGKNVWPVDADEKDIEQVILNIAVKARQEISRGGQLTITTENVKLKHDNEQNTLRTTFDSYVNISFFYNIKGGNKDVIDTDMSSTPTTHQTKIYEIVKRFNGYMNIHLNAEKSVTFNILIPAYTKKHQPHRQASGDVSGPASAKRHAGR
jgi:two-component system, cell cycle sensor histidine kinase and response regulator CckA